MSEQGKGASHGDLSSAGFTSLGIEKGTPAANMMAHADKAGRGKGVVAALQRAGAKGQDLSGDDLSRSDLNSAGYTQDGVMKDSEGADMMRNVDKAGAGGGMKAGLQSIGAKK